MQFPYQQIDFMGEICPLLEYFAEEPLVGEDIEQLLIVQPWKKLFGSLGWF